MYSVFWSRSLFGTKTRFMSGLDASHAYRIAEGVAQFPGLLAWIIREGE